MHKIEVNDPKEEKVFNLFLKKLGKTKKWRLVGADLRTTEGIKKDDAGDFHCPLTAVAQAEFDGSRVEPCNASQGAKLLGIGANLRDEIVEAADRDITSLTGTMKVHEEMYSDTKNENKFRRIIRRRRQMLEAVGLSKKRGA